MSEDEMEKEEFKLQPFKRNSYLYGRLMTVEDFEREQEYFNRKRYLLNRLIHGKGLICGFQHIMLTSCSNSEVIIIFEDGGVALDSLGQEIVIPKSAEKKVMDKDGEPFAKDDFKSTAYLYIKYRQDYYPTSEHETPNPDQSKENCRIIVEDFDVIALLEKPVKNKVDEMVFFAAVKKSCDKLSIDYTESSRFRHYLKAQNEGTAKNNIIATGVIHFKQPTLNSMTSSSIDLKLGNTDDQIFVQLYPEEIEENHILTDHYGISRKNEYPFKLKTIFNRSSRTFKVQVMFSDESERRPIRIRWWASKADNDYGTEEVKPGVFLVKYKFLSDPDPKVKEKIVENGLCSSGAKNYKKGGTISGGDHYARLGNEVALNGNPRMLAELVKEQDEEPKYLYTKWDVGGSWVLKVESFDNTSKKPEAEIKLYFDEKELKSFRVHKGDLITYSEDILTEKNVPLFVTYIDEIYIPSINGLIEKEAKIVLKYTWAVSKHVRYTE